jgi:hypothetical protein
MRRTMRSWVHVALAAGLVILAAGCAAAVAGGAAGGYYFTSRGVGSTVEGEVPDVAARTRAVLSAEGIAITERTIEGDKQTLKGAKGDLEISVEIEEQSPETSKVEISARKNLVEWDKDYARRVMDRIVQTG